MTTAKNKKKKKKIKTRLKTKKKKKKDFEEKKVNYTKLVRRLFYRIIHL